MRIDGRFRAPWAAALAIPLLFAFAMPAQAQEADIDAIVDASASPGAALVLAHRQAGDGDLTGAAATLERALISYSGSEIRAVRLYYVSILCRLDDQATARSELAKLEGLEIGEAEWTDVRKACGYVPQVPTAGPARSGKGVTGEIAAGIAYDSDLAGALLVQFDIPGFTTPGNDGFSALASAQIAGRAPIGGAYLYGNAAAITKNSIEGPSLDYQLGELEFGLGTRGRGFEVTAGGIARHAILFGDPFVTELGGAAEVALMLGGDDRLSLRGEIVGQNYAGSSASFSRDGTRYDLALAYQGRAGAADYYLAAGYEQKTSQTARTGYSGARAIATFRQQLSPGGLYTTLMGTVRYVEYVDEAGFAPTNETRWFARAALGLPIGRRGLAIEAAGNFTARDYNAASGILDYHSVGGELRLVWTFGN